MWAFDPHAALTLCANTSYVLAEPFYATGSSVAVTVVTILAASGRPLSPFSISILMRPSTARMTHVFHRRWAPFRSAAHGANLGIQVRPTLGSPTNHHQIASPWSDGNCQFHVGTIVLELPRDTEP